jgi:hypothetical protein
MQRSDPFLNSKEEGYVRREVDDAWKPVWEDPVSLDRISAVPQPQHTPSHTTNARESTLANGKI